MIHIKFYEKGQELGLLNEQHERNVYITEKDTLVWLSIVL